MGGGGGGQSVPGTPLFDDSGTIGRHPPLEDVPDFTPMIDMTFLLLAFFIVTSTMDAGSTLKLPPARSGKGVGSQNSTVITIFYEDGQPAVYLSDGRKQDGPATMPEVTDYVRRGVAGAKPTVLIKADHETPSGFVKDVARAAAQVEGVRGFFVGIRDYSM